MPEPRSTAKLQKQQPGTIATTKGGRVGAFPVPAEFYGRDPRRIAPELLGKVLVRREGRQLRAGRIVELEAYLGLEDAAAHAFSGKTKRNDVLFGPPGHA